MASTNERKAREMMKMMAKLAVDGDETVHLADVVRHDGPGIQIPADLELDTAINILSRKRDEEEEETYVSATIPAFPYDGAHALKLAMEELFGYVVSKRCLCGRNHNVQIEVVTDAAGTMVTVPWGQFEVPNIEGHLETGYTWEGKRLVFQIQGNIKGKSKPKFDTLVKLTQRYAIERSIYRNKAFSVRFRDEDGCTKPIPEIKFLDVARAQEPIYTASLEEQLRNDVLAYITHSDLVRPLNGGVLKRGVLFAGPYGTGKTLAATWIARQAVEHDWTYIYVTDPNDFYEAHMLARAYQPAVVFVEDVDKIAGVERTQEVDRLLNCLDGADTKKLDVMVVFTTNYGERITQAMYRPGRIDFLFRATPPDADAARRLVWSYADGRIDGTIADLQEAGNRLAGKIPATIKEAVARAQVRAVVRSGNQDALISNEDLVRAAESIEAERTTYEANDPSDVEKLGRRFGASVLRETADLLGNHTLHGAEAPVS